MFAKCERRRHCRAPISGSSHCGVWGGVQSVPGIVGSVVGRRPNTGVRLGRLINQNSHVIRVPELCAAPENVAIPTVWFQSLKGLHGIMCDISEEPQHETPQRHHEVPQRPKQKTTQAQKTPTTPTTATSTGALHPMRGAAPVTWRCTRYVAVHPNRRGALPTDRVQCPNKQEQTRNWHTEPLTAAPLHAQLGPTGGRMGTPPTPPPALRPTPAHSDTLTCEEPD